MYGGWELPTSHGIFVGVGKIIDRARKVGGGRKPLTWELLNIGLKDAAEVDTEQWVDWSGLALSFRLASEIWAYGNGLVHIALSVTRKDLVLFGGACQLAWDDRRAADRVEVKFRGSKSDDKR